METLTLTGLSPSTKIEVTPKFIARRNEALTEARTIIAVTDGKTQRLALSVLSDLKALRLGLETTRKAIKEPIIQLGKRIEEIAREAGGEITSEEARVKALVENFAAEKLRQERIAEAERQRIIREAEDAERRAVIEREQAEARARQAAAEAAAKAKGKGSAKASKEAANADAALNAADVAAEEARRQREEAEEKAQQIVSSAPVMVGASARPVWDYEITDLNRFAAVYPDLVTITPKRAEILKALNQQVGVFGVEACEKSPENVMRGLRLVNRVKLNVR